MQPSTPTTGHSSTREELDFLAERMGRFGKAAFFVAAAALVIRVILNEGTEVRDRSLALTMGIHLVGTLALGVLWAGGRFRGRSLRFLRAFECGTVLAVSACYAFMTTFMGTAERPDLVVILATGLIYLARAVYIPSPAGTTLRLGLVLSFFVLLVAWLTFKDIQPALWEAPRAVWWQWTTDQVLIGVVGSSAMWWMMVTALGTLTSRVIYGLRKEVRDFRRLGQYTLLEKLGEGGMGEVYRAQHAMLRRPTAVKLLPPAKVGEDAVLRFEREVQLTAQLTHPNTVTIYDYGRTPEGIFYYAMELLEGANLMEIVGSNGPQPEERIVHILIQCADALAEAHGIGLIHRDVKPSNIMLCERGGLTDVVKIVDFGLVKEMDSVNEPVTQDQIVMGTPHYMSPESVRAPHTVDARSDIYSLGCVGWYLLTGRSLFQGETFIEICSHHLHTPPEPPSQNTSNPISPELEDLILRCLCKSPEHRPQDAALLSASLRSLPRSPWSQDDARSWWNRHRPKISKTSATTVHEGTTFRIDIEHLTGLPSAPPRDRQRIGPA